MFVCLYVCWHGVCIYNFCACIAIHEEGWGLGESYGQHHPSLLLSMWLQLLWHIGSILEGRTNWWSRLACTWSSLQIIPLICMQTSINVFPSPCPCNINPWERGESLPILQKYHVKSKSLKTKTNFGNRQTLVLVSHGLFHYNHHIHVKPNLNRIKSIT